MTVWVGLIALGIGLGASLFMPVPQNLKTNFDAGQSLYALGEFEGAIIEYHKIVRFGSRFVRTDSVRVTFGGELELPVIAAAWYQLGNAYKKSGQHEKAVEAYRNVSTDDKVQEDFRSLVQFQMAETRFLQKEFKAAADEYKRYVELFPNSDVAGKAYFYSGWSEFNLKQYDQAIETLEGMLESYPDDRYAPDSQFRIASSYFEKEEFERSVTEAQLVLEKYPNSPVIAQAVYLSANAFDELDQGDEAIKAYREVRDLYDRMFDLLRGSFREGKNVDFDNYRHLFETSSLRVAEIYRKTNQFDNAYRELIAAQETAEERFYKASVQVRIGDNYMEWDRFDDAWTAYNQVIELYGDTPYPSQAQFYKGEARYYGGKYADAREEYLKVASEYPDSDTELRAAALYTAGWSSEKLEEYPKALEHYSRVVQDFPRSERAPSCLLRIAQVNKQQQSIDEAEKAYQTIVDNYSENQEISDAYYGLGLLYRDSERLDEAVESFSKVDRGARETYIAALIEAANIHIRAERPEEGRVLLQELLEGVTGDPDLESTAHYQMAQLDLNNKQYTDAVERYTLVIEQYPNSQARRDSHYGRGLAYHYNGRYSRALEDYQWLLNSELPAPMRLKVEFSMALSYSAQGDDASATTLLNKVIDSGDESLARTAQLQLISMAEKQDPEDAIRTYESMLAKMSSQEDKERVLIRLASAYFRLDQFQKSIDAAQQLIEVAVDVETVSNALFIQGNSYFKSSDYPQAIAVYQRIIDNYPQIGWAKNALFQIGVSYKNLSAGDINLLPAMSKTFTDYYTQYPEDERSIYAWYYDAWAKYRMGKWEDASNTFKRLAGLYPKSRFASESLFRSGEATFNLTQKRGNSVDRDRRYLDAMAIYDDVIKRYPKSDFVDDALYNKAWCLINLKREAEAIPVFEEIVEKHLNGTYGARSQFTLGDFYYKEKLYEEATANYEKFLALFPQNKLKGQDSGLRRKANTLLGHLGEIDAYNLYSEGEKLFDAKQYEEAVEIFKSVPGEIPRE